MLKKVEYLGILIFAFSFFNFVQAQNKIEVGNVDYGEVDFKGFSLSRDGEITISGEAGYFDEWDDDLLFYGWILDSRTREVVWNLLDDSDHFRRHRREGLIKFTEIVELPAGNYEVYFTGMYDKYDGDWNLGDIFAEIFGSSRRKYKRGHKNNLGMTVTGTSAFSGNDGRGIVDKMSKDAIVSFIRMGDDEYKKKSFAVTDEVEVSIYALGEGRRSSAYDYGWIYDENNHRKVWEMKPRSGDHAGGGSKNYVIDDQIILEPGTYTVHYVTDDSHSFYEWNVLPPFDPQFWGISIWVSNDGDMSKITKATEIKTMEPVVELIRVRDDEILSQGLKVKSEVEVRVLCLGEAGNRKTMVDYGWIANADTREIVWEMTRRKSDHAGGDDKNRMIDELIRLEPGNYTVNYITDDSHSYRDWNSSPPFDKERWGITIWPTNESDRKKFELFDKDDYKSDKVVAEIIRVRDDEYRSERFDLDKKTKVRIIALGEGEDRSGSSRKRRGEMFDYGWIENKDNGRVVWEMRYSDTDHAGGGNKNRIFNGVIELEAGSYEVFYESDDSHSYRDWNVAPPRNGDRYGITILREE